MKKEDDERTILEQEKYKAAFDAMWETVHAFLKEWVDDVDDNHLIFLLSELTVRSRPTIAEGLGLMDIVRYQINESIHNPPEECVDDVEEDENDDFKYDDD